MNVIHSAPTKKSPSKSFFGLQPSGFCLSQAETFFYWSHSNLLQYNNPLIKIFQWKNHWTYENFVRATRVRSLAALSKTILFRSISAKFWFSLTMLLIISNHTQNSVIRLRYSAVIFQIDTLTWIFWRRAILHITWQKVRKELFYWTVSGSQNLILLANIGNIPVLENQSTH